MEYVIVAVGIAVFIGVICVIAKKDSKECNEMVSNLTEEQKNFLVQTEVKSIENNVWTQEAIVAKVNEKGNKVAIRFLWYNKVLQNNEYNTITIGDANITKAEQETHNLKVGDKIKVYFAPEKTVGSVKIIFE